MSTVLDITTDKFYHQDCPICKFTWGYYHEGEQYSKLIGIENPEVYDGISWWKCPQCNSVWDRWTGKLEHLGVGNGKA